MQLRATLLIMFILSMLLASCGFHLRGQKDYSLPFHKIYVKSLNDTAPFIIELKNAIRASNVQVTDTPEEAQLTLQIISEKTDKQILSLSVAGTVLEYRIYYKISLRAYNQKEQEWIAPQEIIVQRAYSYSDSQVLAAQQEEGMLSQDMRTDTVQQVLRRLNHAHPPL